MSSHLPFAAPLRRGLLAGLFALAAAVPAAAQDRQEGVKKATHGDWDIVCIEERDICAMQQVGRDSQGNAVLAVEVQKLDGLTTNDGRPVPALIQVTTRIGVLLRPGVVVQIDGGQRSQINFEVCLPDRCIATRPLLDDALNAYKRGANAQMSFAAPVEGQAREFNVTISLRGFTAGFNAL